MPRSFRLPYGEIADETDNDRDLIVLVEPNQWRVDGRFPVEDAVELGWPVVESDDYETLAGWIIHAGGGFGSYNKKYDHVRTKLDWLTRDEAVVTPTLPTRSAVRWRLPACSTT